MAQSTLQVSKIHCINCHKNIDVIVCKNKFEYIFRCVNKKCLRFGKKSNKALLKP